MDPDYEQYGDRSTPTSQPTNDTDVNKITDILNTHISAEIDGLEKDIFETDKRLNETRLILDRLRAAMLISFYKKAESKNNQTSSQGIHPAVKPEIGKSIPAADRLEPFKSAVKETPGGKVRGKGSNQSAQQGKLDKIQHRVIVGNVSKYIPVDMRQRNDQSTHKWMVYVRGPREHPDISHFVKSVWFFLHPTYKPNDLVEVTSPPFHLTRRGWGEFPVRVQLCLKDCKGRKVDIIHHLKLDRTYTGEQNLGAETHVDVQVQLSDPDVPTTSDTKLSAAAGDAVRSTEVSDTPDTTTRHASPEKRVKTSSMDCKPRAATVPGPTNSMVVGNASDKRGTDGTTGMQPLRQKIKLEPEEKGAAFAHETKSSDILPNGWHARFPCFTGVTTAAVAASNVSTVQPNSQIGKYSTDVAVRSSSVNPRSIVLKSGSLNQARPKGVSLLRPRHPSASKGSTPGSAKNNKVPCANSLLKQPMVVTECSPLDQAAVRKPSIMPPVEVVCTSSRPKGLESFSASNTAASSPKTPLPVYVKCALPDGKVMLIRKHVIDQTKQRQLSNDTKLNSSVLAGGHTTIATKDEPSDSRLESGQKACLPPAALIPDIETLLGKLACLYPLLCTASTQGKGPTLPAYDTYNSWPLGKRRALEWQRAKRMHRHLVEYYDRFSGLKSWTTKSLLIWCRRHLYSPCCEGDKLLPLPKSVVMSAAGPELKTIGRQLLSEDRRPNKWGVNEEDLVDVTAPAAEQDKVKEQKEASSLHISLLADEQDAFMSDLVSQCGVKLGTTSLSNNLSANATSCVLYTLYSRFMEELVRRSHATRSSSDGSGELLPANIHAAVRSNQMFEFLDQVFIDDCS